MTIIKYYTFYRENNNFEDILSDPSIKKLIDTKIEWLNHLLIGIYDPSEQAQSILTLKFGDEMIPSPVKNFDPIPGIDYIPEQDINKYKKVVT